MSSLSRNGEGKREDRRKRAEEDRRKGKKKREDKKAEKKDWPHLIPRVAPHSITVFTLPFWNFRTGVSIVPPLRLPIPADTCGREHPDL